MECNKCGICCSVVALSFDINDKKTYETLKDDESYKFALKHFTPITHKEGLKINPYLQKWLNLNPKHWFYKCDMFDEETRLCKDYANRPYMCEGFPLYGKNKLKSSEILYSENCAYNKLIEGEQK